MSKSISERNTQIEELVDFLSFFRDKFDLSNIPVRQNSKKGYNYNFPRLPDFSALNKLFTQEHGLDYLYKSYKDNKAIIKEFQKKIQHKDIKRLLSYLHYMKKQESANHIYLTHTEKTKNDYIYGLKNFINIMEKASIDIKTLKYSSGINKKLPGVSQMDEKTASRYIKDISCIIQNINKGIFPGIFTESDCLPCLKFFTNGKIKYFNDDMYFYPVPILRLIPDRNMSVSDALQSNFKAYYLEKIVEKNIDIISKILPSPEQNTVGRKRRDDFTILCAILYKFWTDIKWKDLSAAYPGIDYRLCKKRKSEWASDDTFRRIRKKLRALPKSPDGERRSDIKRLSFLLSKMYKQKDKQADAQRKAACGQTPVSS